MKIKTKSLSYEEVLKIKPKQFVKTTRPNLFFRTLLRVISVFDLISAKFTFKRIGMEKLDKKEPCLILMNHSSFIDMEIAQRVMYPRPMNIICTTDGFVGKNWLMGQIGCIPTIKFTNDLRMIRETVNAVKKLKSSILLYPEAGYSFDGTATTLPDSVAKFIKMLKIPVVMITTYGAYLRQPLFNNLNKRQFPVEATVEYILSKEEVESKSEQEINDIVKELFSFDNYKWQQENNIIIDEDNRAEGLNRILYKCPNCLNEGDLKGEGTTLTCPKCGKVYELTENGFMKAKVGETEIDHIPNWYKWERECVKEEILQGTYHQEFDVDLYMMIDSYHIYKLGDGHLVHNIDGFKLTAFDGKLDYSLDSKATYTCNSDFNWYEMGDIVSINDTKKQFYCFPKTSKDVVAKMRLATEEIYKIKNNK